MTGAEPLADTPRRKTLDEIWLAKSESIPMGLCSCHPCRVPQGSILSLVLFNISINDLGTGLEGTNSQMIQKLRGVLEGQGGPAESPRQIRGVGNHQH